MYVHRLWITWVGVLVLFVGFPKGRRCTANEKPLTAVKIAKKGKAATALLSTGRTVGTAFCIHPSGLFLTSYKATGLPVRKSLELVLDPNGKAQKVYSARVVRTDATLDLALLKVESKAEFSPLPLATAPTFWELAQNICLGFPANRNLRVGSNEYPSVVVRKVAITRVQRNQGKATRFYLDGTPGVPGGPVLDMSGHVVGILAGLPNRDASYVIPIQATNTFLGKPYIQFTPPVIDRLNKHKPATFSVRVSQLRPSTEALQVELELGSNGKKRSFAMQGENSEYRATLIPVQPPAANRKLSVALDFERGSIRGFMKDRTIRVADRTLSLSGLRAVRFEQTVSVLLNDGDIVKGILSDTKPLVVEIGEQKLVVNLQNVVQLTTDPSDWDLPIDYTVTVRSNERELVRLQGRIGTTSEPLGRTVQLLEARSRFAPKDDQTRFHLGTFQVFRAVERFGQSLYQRGLKSRHANFPLLRLPVPRNPDPMVMTYGTFRQILEQFRKDLERAEITLAGITDRNVKLPIHLARIHLDLDGDGIATDEFSNILEQITGTQPALLHQNPDFFVNLDRGDVAWLRAYCHLVMGMLEAYLAVDTEKFFNQFADDLFARVNKRMLPAKIQQHPGLIVAEPKRFHHFRLHWIQLAELNRETWKYVRAETDNDREWLPNPKQQGVLGLPVRDNMIDTWLSVIAEMEALMQGKKSFPKDLGIEKDGKGLNVKTLLENPPRELVNLDLPEVYWEDLPQVDLDSLFRLFAVFEGPGAFAYAAWFN